MAREPKQKEGFSHLKEGTTLRAAQSLPVTPIQSPSAGGRKFPFGYFSHSNSPQLHISQSDIDSSRQDAAKHSNLAVLGCDAIRPIARYYYYKPQRADGSGGGGSIIPVPRPQSSMALTTIEHAGGSHEVEYLRAPTIVRPHSPALLRAKDVNVLAPTSF